MKNGKVRRQTAIIRIWEKGEREFSGSLTFEPSIRGKKKDTLKAGAEDNIAVQLGWFLWEKLKEQRKGHIILTDA